MKFELRKYKANGGFFRTDYIVGDTVAFAAAHQEGGDLFGDEFEVVETYENYEEFATKKKELIDNFYSGERNYNGESFSLYACCEGGVIAGF